MHTQQCTVTWHHTASLVPAAPYITSSAFLPLTTFSPHTLIIPPSVYHYFSCSLLLPSSFFSPYLPSPSPLHISRTINETVPTLIRNPYAWNKVANVLFCECTHENVIHLMSQLVLLTCPVIVTVIAVNGALLQHLFRSG